MRESQIEKYLVAQVKALGGEVRKVQWIGRRGAPDRLVMLPGWRYMYADAERITATEIKEAWDSLGQPPLPNTIWVELKNPETIKTFPANPHERQQHREHERMRAMGQRVVVIGTIEQVDELLS